MDQYFHQQQVKRKANDCRWLLLTLLCLAGGWASPLLAQPAPAKPADTFVNSVGVVTKLNEKKHY